MTWDALQIEFDAWREADLTLPFWWRDDDAIAQTPELEHLADLSNHVNIPVHIAVIPAYLDNSLLDFCGTHRHLIPIVHGFSHENHAAKDAKKCEFPVGRDVEDVTADLTLGLQKLTQAFGEDLQPMFVPPWNRFDPAFLTILQSIDYAGFSTFTPRKSKWAVDGVEQINTHVDPIDWHGTRTVTNPDVILAHTTQSLRDRRMGNADNTEPFGFLTHHLVHDPEIWAFCEQFLTSFAQGPIRVWTAAELNRKG